MTKKNQPSTINHQPFSGSAGFSLIELLIVMGIIVMTSGFIIAFQRDLFSINSFLQQSFFDQQNAEAAIKVMINEIRTAAASSVGGYPIQNADKNSLTFYADIDGDALQERIEYYLQGSNLRKSVVKPVGNPLTYGTTTAQEILITAAANVVASSSAPIFSYYDGNYAGTSSAMTIPLDIIRIRSINIRLNVNSNTNGTSGGITVSSQVTIRNLKDNL